MDRQQIIDLMSARNYVVYADGGTSIIFFRNLKWTKLTAKVDLFSQEVQFIFLTPVGALLTIQSQWVDVVEIHAFHRNESSMIRAMISLGVGK